MKIKVTVLGDEGNEICSNFVHFTENGQQINLFNEDTLTLGLPKIVIHTGSRFPPSDPKEWIPIAPTGWDEW